jgi:hypothetical protein
VAQVVEHLPSRCDAEFNLQYWRKNPLDGSAIALLHLKKHLLGLHGQVEGSSMTTLLLLSPHSQDSCPVSGCTGTNSGLLFLAALSTHGVPSPLWNTQGVVGMGSV